MRVCVVDLAGSFGPLNSYLDVASALADRGWDHSFVVPVDAAPAISGKLPDARIIGIDAAVTKRRDLGVARCVREAVRGGAALVHGNTTSSARGAVLGAASLRTPALVHLRNSALSRGERLMLEMMAAPPFRVSMVAVSEGALQVAGRIARHMAVVIPDAVKDVPVRPGRALGSPARVGIVANWMPTKGFDVFVDVAVAMRDSDVVFEVFGSAGMADSPSELVKEGRRRLEREGVAEKVLFHGVVPDLDARLCQLDVMLVTSRRESFSRVAAESMLADLPLVVPRIPGLLETVAGGTYAGTYAVADAASAVAALEEVLNGYAAARERSEGAREWARERYSPAVVASHLDVVYKQCVGEVKQ